VYIALQFLCVALFRLSVSLLLVYRGARPDVPWLFVIVSATVLGWILSNASVNSPRMFNRVAAGGQLPSLTDSTGYIRSGRSRLAVSWRRSSN
jgi:hypothetical protein